MDSTRYTQNFGKCQLNDQRLNHRALKIGQALTQKFGQALSTIFESTKELKRAYEFSLILRAGRVPEVTSGKTLAALKLALAN